VYVGRPEAVPDDRPLRCEIDGTVRVVVRAGGGYRGLDGVCTHEQVELSEGCVEDGALWCPAHDSGFDLLTGAVTNLPATEPLRAYDVVERDGGLYMSVEPRRDD
jgi:3-phenylpropionate/trans-cinnamate dioxygenase ferredoxin subunit